MTLFPSTHAPRSKPVAHALCAFATGLLLAIAVTAPMAAQATTPQLVVEQPIVDLGTITRGSVATATFELKNQGSATLELYSVRSSCSCAKIEHPSEIKKGATATITVEVDTFSLSGPSTASVVLDTNDPDNPRNYLTVKVNSKDILGAQPQKIRFRVYQQFLGDGVIKELIFASDNADFKITKIESPLPFVRISEVVLATEDQRIPLFSGSQWVFEVQLDNNPPVGNLAGYITVHTDHPTQKILSIPLSGFVRPLVALTPESFDLGKITVSETRHFWEIHVKQFAEEPMTIEKTECDIEGVEVVMRELTPGRVWKVRVILPASQELGPFAGTVTLHTSNDRKKTILIPISGTILAQEASG